MINNAYTMYFCNGEAARDRRLSRSPDEGVDSYTDRFDSEEEAIIDAALEVMNRNNYPKEEMHKIASNFELAEEFLDEQDYGDGTPFCFAIKRGADFIYGDQAIMDQFDPDKFDEDEFDDLEDDYIDFDNDEDEFEHSGYQIEEKPNYKIAEIIDDEDEKYYTSNKDMEF